jgi:hypothetical protein
MVSKHQKQSHNDLTGYVSLIDINNCYELVDVMQWAIIIISIKPDGIAIDKKFMSI